MEFLETETIHSIEERSRFGVDMFELSDLEQPIRDKPGLSAGSVG